MRKTNIWRKDITISSNWLQKRLLAEIRKDLRVVCILSENGRKSCWMISRKEVLKLSMLHIYTCKKYKRRERGLNNEKI